jgi:hypothetical protein
MTEHDNRSLVERRTKALIERIQKMWRALPGAYPLQIEDEAQEAAR